jgi:hypothetical protein
MAAIRAGGRRSYRLTGSSLLMHFGTRRSGLMAAIRAGGRRSYRLTGSSLLMHFGTP